MIQFIRP